MPIGLPGRNEEIPRNIQLLKLSQKENLNRPIMNKEIGLVIKNLSTQKIPGSYGFNGEFYETFKEEAMLVLLKLPTWKRRDHFEVHFKKAVLT